MATPGITAPWPSMLPPRDVQPPETSQQGQGCGGTSKGTCLQLAPPGVAPVPQGTGRDSLQPWRSWDLFPCAEEHILPRGDKVRGSGCCTRLPRWPQGWRSTSSHRDVQTHTLPASFTSGLRDPCWGAGTANEGVLSGQRCATKSLGPSPALHQDVGLCYKRG